MKLLNFLISERSPHDFFEKEKQTIKKPVILEIIVDNNLKVVYLLRSGDLHACRLEASILVVLKWGTKLQSSIRSA